MKISIYEEVPAGNKELEFLLRLEKVGDYVYLRLVDEDGTPIKRGSLLRINPDMTFSRTSHIDKRLGLTLNDDAELAIVGMDI